MCATIGSRESVAAELRAESRRTPCVWRVSYRRPAAGGAAAGGEWRRGARANASAASPRAPGVGPAEPACDARRCVRAGAPCVCVVRLARPTAAMPSAVSGKRVFWPGSGLDVVEYDLLTIEDDVVFGSRSSFLCGDADAKANARIRLRAGSGSNVADRCVGGCGCGCQARCCGADIKGRREFDKSDSQVCVSDCGWPSIRPPGPGQRRLLALASLSSWLLGAPGFGRRRALAAHIVRPSYRHTSHIIRTYIARHAACAAPPSPRAAAADAN